MIKKIVFVLTVLLLAVSTASADVDAILGVSTYDECLGVSTYDAVAGQAVAAGGDGDCPEGTYLFYWDGDHSSGEMYACVDSGNSTKNGTNDGTDRIDATGENGSQGFTKTASGQYVKWAVVSDDIIDDTVGTVWVRVYTSADTGEVFAGGSYDSNDYWNIQTREDNRNRAYRDDGTANNNQSSNAADPYSDATWTWHGYTWNQATGIHCCDINDTASDWECSGNEISAFGNVPNEIGIGEDDWGLDADNETIIIDRIYIYGTYQAEHP